TRKKQDWECEIRMIVSDRARLSYKQIKLCPDKASYFNNILANHIRTVIMQKIKVYMKFDKNIKRAIENSLDDLGIDEENLTYDTLAKYYQRHRKKLNLPSVYKTFKLCS